MNKLQKRGTQSEVENVRGVWSMQEKTIAHIESRNKRNYSQKLKRNADLFQTIAEAINYPNSHFTNDLDVGGGYG